MTVYAEGYENYHEIELSYLDLLSGNTKTIIAKFDGSSFNFRPNVLIGGFGLRPTFRLFSGSKINRIEVQGIEQANFSDIVNVIRNINQETDKIILNLNRHFTAAKDAENRVLSSKSTLDELETSIDEKNKTITELSSQIEQLSKTRGDIDKKIEVSRSVQSRARDEEQELRDRLSKLKSDINLSVKNISESESELKKLQDEINMFPAEISGYVSQGAKNIKLYTTISIIPILIICIITYRLFANAEGILNYEPNNWKNVFEFLISRTPYVIVSFAILAVCYTIINRLISEIIGINRRRQDLFKVSIIASDVAYASQHDIDIDPEEAYNLRNQTKMELLKEHLKQHIGEDFTYKPKSLFHKITSIASSHLDEKHDENATGPDIKPPE